MLLLQHGGRQGQRLARGGLFHACSIDDEQIFVGYEDGSSHSLTISEKHLLSLEGLQ